jgi:Lipopolysaccharide kinase (Kdo/WaaP) family
MRVRLSVRDTGRAKLLVNPAYRPLLERAGLLRVEDFLALPAVIVCGHRHRHVAQLTLRDGASAVRFFLKRELRVPWKVYLSSAWAGFGWVTRSYREALLLRELHECGVPCPDWVAAGEDEGGQAFLLVRELPQTRELGQFLRETEAAPGLRRRFVQRLGSELAKLHKAGFHHADLHSKHVLVGGDGETVHFLDWQRSRRFRFLSWRRRLSDLAALDATLDDALASPRERLRCLRAYLRASASLEPRMAGAPRQSFAGVVTSVCRLAVGLLRKRYIREVRQASLPIGHQNLIWLDGEALCVTREFQAALDGHIPSWLVQAASADQSNGVVREQREVPGARQAILVRRWVRRPLRWLWQRLRGRPFTSPELQQAALLFRLQRYGITTPRLLAVGQRYRRPWQSESFLLTEPALCQESLPRWLARQSRRAEQAQRYRQVLRQTGAVLRRLRDAGCYLDERLSFNEAGGCTLAVRDCLGESPAVVVTSLDGIRALRRAHPTPAGRDLACWRRALSNCAGSRTDVLRFCLGYVGQHRLTPAGKRLFRWLLCQRCRR